QPRTGALSRRAAGNQFVRQININQSDIHHVLPSWGQAGDDSLFIDQNHGLWSPDWYTAARLPEWRNGRRSGFKIHRWQHRAGSSPASGTNYETRLPVSIREAFSFK